MRTITSILSNLRPFFLRGIMVMFTLVPASLFSQGEFNNWYIPNRKAFTFNSGIPVLLPESPMLYAAVTVNVSDSSGNLLFYSEGSRVWNRNNVVMPHGDGLIASGGSFTQMVAVVKKMDEDSIYYLFTDGSYNSGMPSASWSPCYSILDMRLDGGMGDIDVFHKNIPLHGGQKGWEAVTCARHKNNRDAWGVIRLLDSDSNYFASYRITSFRVDTTPVLSVSKVFIPPPGPFWIPINREIKISPDGKQLTCVYTTDTLEICDFDPETGQVHSRFVLRPKINGNNILTTQVEYSINSKLLYLTGCTGDAVYHVYQFDATLVDSAAFSQSILSVGEIGHDHSALQMAPDLKLYGTRDDIDTLWIINYPSVRGTGCGFQNNGFCVENPTINIDGLPQFVQRYKVYIHYTGNCQYQNVTFTGDIWPPPDSVYWDFGDPASGGFNISNDYPASHIYNSPGDYNVELIVRHIDQRFDTEWIQVHIAPTYLPQLGPDQTICSGDSVTFDAGFCAGCSYLWTDLIADTIVSTSQTFTTGSPGTYSVKVINTEGCKGYDTVQLFTIVPPVVTTNPLSKSICSGDSTRIALTANVPGTTFSWSAAGSSPLVTGFSPGVGDTINQVLLNTNTVDETVTYWITPAVGNCAGDSIGYFVTVTPGDSVKVSITASANNICVGTSVTFTATPTNGGATPSYQWKVNGINTGLDLPVYTYVPVNGDVVTCVLTSSNAVCTSNNPATSNTITMIVNPNMPVSITITALTNPVCSGTPVTFTATPQNEGLSPVYQWQVNGINVGTNSPVYTYVPLSGDLVSCILTSSETFCVTNNPATSNAIIMTVNPNMPVSVSIISSANPVCSGTSVTFTATPTNGGTTPSYQWKVNGINTGTNNLVYTYLPVNNDVVTCILTSSETICVINNPATSNPITMTVNPNLPVSVSIAASANPVCSGTSVIFTATPVNGGTTPSYQWRVNGINVGTNNPVYTYNPVSGDIISCILTSSETVCVTNNPATSNLITMIVNPTLAVSVSISASNNPVCAGNPVTYTAIPANEGASPVYQWRVNGVNVGANSPMYTYNPVNGDVITCILTSSITCPMGNPAMSNSIIMGVAALPVVTFTLCNDPVTTTNAAPFKLKGGLPLGGTYSGPGVNSATGIFYPALSGTGIKTITYSYTNAALCSANATLTITVVATVPFVCGNNLTDVRDNKAYPTVQLGIQCWMAANLNYGTQIAGSIDQRDNCIVEKYCYNDLTANCGRQTFYQWDELMQFDATQGIQGLCPPAWHVPTEADWNTLFAVYINNAFAGSPLKYSGYSEFNALLTGVRLFNKSWNYDGFATFFWSSTSWGPTKAWAHAMNDMDPSVALYPSYRTNAFSVRCVKD